MESRATLSMDKVFEDLDKWLREKGITLSKCDLLEHFLLAKAEIKRLGSCSFSWWGEGSVSQVNFSLGKLTNTDAKKFLLFLHAMGDKRAQLTYGYFGEDRIENMIGDDGGRCVIFRKPAVSFMADGTSFANTILPLFKAYVMAAFTSNPALLKPYQDQSGIFVKPAATINIPGALYYSPPAAARLPRPYEPSHDIDAGLRNNRL